mmetsp:Transcript_149351/g.479629  ORF Transcript_149351/g.479629 Transcript_149351/m.479629 type:complete len:242 (-) Transcript_149351:308-1033(-)
MHSDRLCRATRLFTKSSCLRALVCRVISRCMLGQQSLTSEVRDSAGLGTPKLGQVMARHRICHKPAAKAGSPRVPKIHTEALHIGSGQPTEPLPEEIFRSDSRSRLRGRCAVHDIETDAVTCQWWKEGPARSHHEVVKADDPKRVGVREACAGRQELGVVADPVPDVQRERPRAGIVVQQQAEDGVALRGAEVGGRADHVDLDACGFVMQNKPGNLRLRHMLHDGETKRCVRTIEIIHELA